MDKKHPRDLENPENWDFEQPETRAPVKPSRVVVSVAFQRDDFTMVSEYAERVGKKTSEFIREAAIEKASGKITVKAVFVGGVGPGQLFSRGYLPTFTIASAQQVEHSEEFAGRTGA